MSSIALQFPNGKQVSVEAGLIVEKILESPESGLEGKAKKKVLGIKVNGALFDLQAPIWEGGQVQFIEPESEAGLYLLRHSTSHVLATAVKELFPEAKLTIGPPIENGFYYDFDVPKPFTDEDLVRLESRMKEIINENQSFVRKELDKGEAQSTFRKMDEAYKLELIEDIENQESGNARFSTYQNGGFLDLCRGPHVRSTGQIKAFKLLSVAGAYWRGDEHNKMLSRIYGTAFFSKQELADHLHRLEEAKRRDHRKLGPELGLFSISDDLGPGLCLWHPKGARIRNEIENFWREAHFDRGYDLLYTPHIAKLDLWETSGHTGFYSDNMYSPMEVDEKNYQIKPMNCPFHIQIYKSGLRSYQDLPFRWAELGTVYRYERSGVLHGLLRVRGFTQDDAHIFCRPDQVEDEIEGVLDLTFYMLKAFGFEDFQVYLSTRPEKFVGAPENWEFAENALRTVLEKKAVRYEIDPGEGVFYGPKIDIKIRDTIGRWWQCSTIQFDFNLPERFGLTYINSSGTKEQPIMVHRALLGSLERFFAILIEYYGGAFPLWLTPIQVKVLSITERHAVYGQQVCETLKKSGIRVEADFRNEKLGYKIREAQSRKVPVLVLVGDQEVDSQTVSIRLRGNRTENGVALEQLIGRIQSAVAEKRLEFQ